MVVMWSNGGNRVTGFHFGYRLVANGTDGQPQWSSNWSDDVTVSFKQGKSVCKWMTAPALGQSFGPTDRDPSAALSSRRHMPQHDAPAGGWS
jgi:hypothetical protein